MVKELNEVYKCSLCSNVMESVLVGGGTLVCCGKEMDLLTENTVDAAKEKHVPVIEETAGGILVKVGAVAHPMEAAHYITSIEVFTNDGLVLRKSLKPGEAPQAAFPVARANVAKVREYCNLHGLWAAN